MGLRSDGGFVPFEKSDIEQSIPCRFEEQVARHADRLALRTKTSELTYAELNLLANHVAHAVLSVSGEAPQPIALLLDQDAPLIAAILGLLKAGMFYVPLDARHPQARNAHMLQHSGARLILCDERNAAMAQQLAGEGCSTLRLDQIDLSRPTENPRLALSPGHLAYVFYTSGSTGQPKGVVDNHRNVLHNIMRYTNGLRIGCDDRLTLLQSCSFSGSVSSLFSALLNGASVFLFDVGKYGVLELANWLLDHRITIYHSVPALFRKLLARGARFPDVRLIRLEGDQASPTDVALFKRHFAEDCVLVNGLGATETGIARRYFVDHDTSVEGAILPVGYAVDDTDILLLNDSGTPVDVGQVGEIVVKSRYLAVGYWRDPELTQHRFQPSPEGGGVRLYHSGDAGRLRPDGCLEHLGRKDFQVKIRGNRVEIEEVESLLLSLPGVKEAVVAAFDDPAGEKRLAAYLVTADGSAPAVDALRNSLSEHVPDYMIPSAFVVLDAVPLTEAGKVDRRALPSPGIERPQLSTPFVPPRTSDEIAIAEIWMEILGLDQVGVHDKFLSLGGDSLRAGQILSCLADTFEIDITYTELFDADTVEKMAQLVARRRIQ